MRGERRRMSKEGVFTGGNLKRLRCDDKILSKNMINMPYGLWFTNLPTKHNEKTGEEKKIWPC